VNVILSPALAESAEGVTVSEVACTPAAVMLAVVEAVPDLNVITEAPADVAEAAFIVNEALPEAVVALAVVAVIAVVVPDVAVITAPLITLPAESFATTVIAPAPPEVVTYLFTTVASRVATVVLANVTVSVARTVPSVSEMRI
jgi:hypothetical protein